MIGYTGGIPRDRYSKYLFSMRRPAFMLIELMLVLAILLMLAAVALPALTGTLEGQRLRHSAGLVRNEWKGARLKAMEEGLIICVRYKIGGNEMLIDRVLDAHFTASLSSRETSGRYRFSNEPDSFERGGFTGQMEDFILRDPGMASEETGSRLVTFPGTVVAVDVIALPDERTAFYLGLTTAGENEVEENVSESDEITRQETRLGETAALDGAVWSTPIFFFPDGTTSTAAVLLKNDRGKCVEIRLRGLTGAGTIGEITTPEYYEGELEPTRVQ